MKTKTVFVCQSCGSQSPRWVGKCPNCEEWNSYVEEAFTEPAAKGSVRAALAAQVTAAPVLLKEVDIAADTRYRTHIGEFDRVMGGGIVPGSVTLIGGDPGIGKSTIILQAAAALAAGGLKVLYISGEESVKQAKMRADRVAGQANENFFIVNEIDVQAIIGYIHELAPQVVIIDSIQVVHLAEISSSPGSVAQVRESAAVLTQAAKRAAQALFLIGHVTKEGMLAGPRVLEHMVDSVLYFEGERYSSYRILRANKNRFGSTNEIGVFEMTARGLQEVLNPSEIFLCERPRDSSGSVVVPILEGTRPFLVEIQGLVSRSAFGMVRQKAQGFDANRLGLLAAVLEKRLGLNLGDKDIFLNVVGGVKVEDPAADLGVTLAIASALLDKVVSHETAVLGEVGLSGEVRSVSQIASRVNEAQKLGFTRCLVPKNNLKNKDDFNPSGIKLVAVTTVREALDKL
ncbi:MAG: DNA repair protein RadA [Candidatus Omnitrophica bacterium]|nr:DNA repair protein RadA [Candidatus Omnitrophota bacterium]